jgi:pyruvate/2-oxoglutarate dehydrogenase complex dihydrolipoamide acyltransferase (E2) component
MDLLRTAVVDITTLMATCRALRPGPAAGELVLQRDLRNRLRRDIKRGTVAYIDVLARTKRGLADDDLLVKCRLAAEQQMAHAIAQQDLLARIMASEAGSLDGLPAARQDLWRLAHVAISLSRGTATLRGSATLVDAKLADALAVHLRRRVRKALIAYARVALRAKGPRGRVIFKARGAALAEIGPHGAAEAERLAGIEAGADPRVTVIRQGVTKPLLDLALDW